jgi:hypothetical protein
MSMSEIRKLVKQLSRFFLDGEMSAPVYAWLAESIIASSDAYGDDSVLSEFADRLASYSPAGGIGLFGDVELMTEATRLIEMLDGASIIQQPKLHNEH